MSQTVSATASRPELPALVLPTIATCVVDAVAEHLINNISTPPSPRCITAVAQDGAEANVATAAAAAAVAEAAAPLVHLSAAMSEAEQPHPALLPCKHWLEVCDPQHRYGTFLRPYYDDWCARGRPDGDFFAWLDHGDGRDVDLSCRPSATARRARPRHLVSRTQLDCSTVRYCDEQERARFRVRPDKIGALRWSDRPKQPLVHTMDGHRWIFVVDEQGELFINHKEKAAFHHSSFVCGAPVRAAGRIEIHHGHIISVAPNSGHYMTSMPHLLRALFDIFGDCSLPVASLGDCDSA